MKAEMITEHVVCTSQDMEEMPQYPQAAACSSCNNKWNSSAYEENAYYEKETDIEEECTISIANEEKEDQQKERRLLGFWEITFVLTAVFSTGNIIMVPW